MYLMTGLRGEELSKSSPEPLLHVKYSWDYITYDYGRPWNIELISVIQILKPYISQKTYAMCYY